MPWANAATMAGRSALLCLVLGVAPGPTLAQAPACPHGQSVTVDTAEHCCWANQAWSNARQNCVGIPLCPEGYEVQGEACQVVACGEGKLRSEDTFGNCCWPNQAWSNSRRLCVGIPACPAGFFAQGEECLKTTAVAPPVPPVVAPSVVEPSVVEPPLVTAPEPPRPAREAKKTYFGIGGRAFFIPEENRWGPAPELSAISVSGGFKGGAVFALLVGDNVGLEVGARMSGGPSLGHGVWLDFGGELGLIFVPSTTALAFDFALNVVAASWKVGPVLLSVRLISPTFYLGITSTKLVTRFGYQGGFTAAF